MGEEVRKGAQLPGWVQGNFKIAVPGVGRWGQVNKASLKDCGWRYQRDARSQQSLPQTQEVFTLNNGETYLIATGNGVLSNG